MRSESTGGGTKRGKLRIGDDWNAITIIALSQSNPLKAIAELVENAIDANARSVNITRSREHGRHVLTVRDDGDGVPRDAHGRPDFHYVATHICDSIKRQLKASGASGVQGEFGIGLLSFWTLGEELRDRIRDSGVRLTVIDRLARKQYAVEPRQYEGRLPHGLPAVRAPRGDVYVELYLNEPHEQKRVALFRNGTRVLEDIALLDDLAHSPWTTRYLPDGDLALHGQTGYAGTAERYVNPLVQR